MQAVQLGGAPIDAAFTDAMDACVQCRGCEVACPSGVQFGHLMEGTRAALQPHRSLARRGGRVARVPRRAAAPRAAARAHVAPRARPAAAPRAAAVRPAPDLDPVAAHAARRRRRPRRVPLHRLRDGRLAARRPPRGADRDARRRRASRAARAAAAAAAARSTSTRGWTTRPARLAAQVIGSLPGDAPVVVDSAGCGAAMKDYGRLLGTDRGPGVLGPRPRLLRVARRRRTRRHCRPTGTTVVVQDPCHLRHVQHAERRGPHRAARRLPPGRDRRRRPVLRRRRRVQRHRARARRRGPRPQGRRDPRRRGRPARSSSRPRTRAARCTSAAAGLNVRHPAELVEEALS